MYVGQQRLAQSYYFKQIGMHQGPSDQLPERAEVQRISEEGREAPHPQFGILLYHLR